MGRNAALVKAIVCKTVRNCGDLETGGHEERDNGHQREVGKKSSKEFCVYNDADWKSQRRVQTEWIRCGLYVLAKQQPSDHGYVSV